MPQGRSPTGTLAFTVREGTSTIETSFDGPFAVITAFHPLGRAIPKIEAARRTDELRALIALQGALSVPMDGSSPGGRHVEPGFAAALPKELAQRIARFFEQIAFFWFDGRRFWVEPACGQ